jgi:ABC-type phosphate transport system substrate-binding protein
MKYFILLTIVLGFANAQVVIIANKSVKKENVNITDIKYIYQLNTKSWSDGSKIKLFDYKGKNATKMAFFKFIKKTPMQLKREWLRAKLTGAGTPPKEVRSEDEMVTEIANTPGAVGYISKSKVAQNVIVIGKIE